MGSPNQPVIPSEPKASTLTTNASAADKTPLIQNSLPKTTVVIAKPTALPLSQSQPLSQISSGKPEYGLFTGIASLALTLVIFVLQSNGVEIKWMVSAILYTVTAVGLTWSTLSHAVPHWETWKKFLIALFVIAVVAVSGTIGTLKQFRHEHYQNGSPSTETTAQLSAKGTAVSTDKAAKQPAERLKIRERSLPAKLQPHPGPNTHASIQLTPETIPAQTATGIVPTPPTQPPALSAYQETAAAIDNINKIEEEWDSGITNIMRSAADPDPKVQDDITEVFIRSDTSINFEFGQTIQPQLERASNEAIARMQAPGNKQITPGEAQEYLKQFGTAMKVAKKGTSIEAARARKPDRSRFVPLRKYFESLHIKLEDYSENPATP